MTTTTSQAHNHGIGKAGVLAMYGIIDDKRFCAKNTGNRRLVDRRRCRARSPSKSWLASGGNTTPTT